MNDWADIFPGDAGMARRMRAFDWTQTPLGHPGTWPLALRTSVRIMLALPQPTFVWWGKPLITFYNDACAALLHHRGPSALGRPASAVWPAIWEQIAPGVARAQRQEPGARDQALSFVMRRTSSTDGPDIAFSCRPIASDDGMFGGMWCSCTEETPWIVSEREARLSFIVRLGDALRLLHDVDAIETTVASMLGAYLHVDRVWYSAIESSGGTRNDVDVFAGDVDAGVGRRVAGFSPAALHALREGRAIIVSDTSDAPDDVGLLPVADIDARAFIACPIVEAGRLAAIVGLMHATPREWTDDDLELIRDVAARALAAIERVRAERTVEADMADITRLQQLSAATVLEHDVATLYGVMLDAAMAIMRADFASLQRLDAAAQPPVLQLLASRGFSPHAERVWQSVTMGSATTCGVALQTGARVIAADVDACPFIMGTEDQENYRETGIRAVQTTPLVSRGGKIVGMISTHWRGVHQPSERSLRQFDVLARQMADLLERSDSEAALRASEIQLKDADQRKDEFIAVLAHELRNPLAPIRTGLELIRVAGDTPAAVQRVRSTMERQVAHMVRLIDDLLDVSRITSGKIRLQRQVTPLDGLINTAIDANRTAIAAGRLHLSVVPPDAPVWLDVDPTRFVQVLSNVLHNAIKFSSDGGQIAIVAAKEPADAGPERLTIAVTDAGAGISREMLPRVFDFFVQGSPTSSNSGLGIGLALARKLMDMHGGSIDARSEGPGRGSVFTLRMPIAADGPASTLSGAGSTVRRTALRVLVIDDNVDAADTLAMLVIELGGEAAVAYSGDTGVARAADLKPDVVFIDIGMPGMDGYDTCRGIRDALASGVVLVALTGWGQEQDKQKAAEAGFDAHLTKPADPLVLERLFARIGSRSV